MATGYNANSKTELANDYKSYKQGDSFDDEEGEYEEHEDSVDIIIGQIVGDDFVIEESETPFDEDENPLYFE